MYEIKVGDNLFEVSFKQVSDLISTARGIRSGTLCHIECGGELFSVGNAAMHPDEQSNKAHGRKVALTDALEMFAEEEDRALFWREYLRVSNVDKVYSDNYRKLVSSLMFHHRTAVPGNVKNKITASQKRRAYALIGVGFNPVWVQMIANANIQDDSVSYLVWQEVIEAYWAYTGQMFGL